MVDVKLECFNIIREEFVRNVYSGVFDCDY